MDNLDKEKDTKTVTNHYSIWFVIIASIFVTCIITSNIISVKLINVFGIILPAGVIIFPVSYIISDILTEVYGYSKSRRIIWLGFLCNLMLTVFIWLSGIIKPAQFWDGQAAYERILGFTPRLLMASFIAYLVGEFANAYVLARMKMATKGRWLWSRTIGSTLVGQGLDSLVFITLSFIGTIPLGALFSMAVSQWLFKTLYEVCVTPFTYIAVGFLKQKEGMDVYDYETSFNPLRLSD
ncbi:MAG: queuosine precursor transporter [Syntrophorhabdaceae bacterium]|nr:queuosine precursor transporter [Syntrophorhabdaceae bacterium]